MKSKYGIILLCAICLIVMVSLLHKRCATDNRADIRIACNVPLTGDLATYGESIRDGMLLAQADLKETDPSFSIVIDMEDNASKANLALTIFNKQKLHKNDYYVSGVKPQTMTIIDGVEKLNIPHFTWIFDAYITQKYNNAYRCWVNYRIEAEYIKKFVEEKKTQKIALVYVQLPHTEELVNTILKPFFDEKGIQYIIEPYDIEKVDFKDIATKIKNSGIDAVYVNGFKINLIGIAKAFEEYKINTSCNNLYTYDFMDAKEELNDEIISHINYIVPSYEIDQKQTKKDWQGRFVAKFKRAPRYTDAYAYDMTFAIYKSIIENKPIKDVTFDGITGKVEFDETGDIVTKLYIINCTNQDIKYVLQEN